MRVLIVDDEPDVRLLLRTQLETAGHEVTGEAADGAEAIELCAATEPDVVILDLLMPRVNGFEAIPKLRTKHPAVGIIAYTAVAGEFVRQEMKRLGIPLVLKSGAFSRLASVIEDAGRAWAPAAVASAMITKKQTGPTKLCRPPRRMEGLRC